MACANLEQAKLDLIFPPEKTNEFFDALYGDIEEGPYDIRLVCNEIGEDYISMAFNLARRPGKCLACNFTYGLPPVFARHPVINAGKIAGDVAKALGWQGDVDWEFLPTRETSEEMHSVPFIVKRK